MSRRKLCGREKPLTFHHLVPKAMHRKKRIQKRFTKEELRSGGWYVCRLCHDGIQDLISAMEPAEKFVTKESLLAHPALDKHGAWVRK